ncbi:hypothetical protein OG257_24285 [Streptomyces sp. NBC_00683]|uniref:hypothetical protein n=1 Tax=Streptomyces sp. NBC_00683 TaxID=2903670 RepID=UPI002E35B8A0|nr:hypothetical protein [Streptomyces sp. NBC_00683]
MLRYGGLGLLSVALAACGGNKDGDEAPGAAGKPARPTVTGAAVQAFVAGAWNLAFTPQGQVNDEYKRIEITGRNWSLDADDLMGSFELTGNELVVRIDNVSTENIWAATGMPGTVGDDASLTLQWGHSAGSAPVDAGSPVDTTPSPLPVTWDGTTLRIQAGNGVVITAVRA